MKLRIQSLLEAEMVTGRGGDGAGGGADEVGGEGMRGIGRGGGRDAGELSDEENYLRKQYFLLREDFLRPLRDR